MSSIVFIATHWGTNEGGINSFNYDFVQSIAKQYRDKFRIVCVVQEAELNEIISAREIGLEILKIEGRFNSSVIFDEVKKNNHDKIICWVGHDIVTGFKAIECANLDGRYLENPSKSVIIHHMSYINYYSAKTGDAEKTVQKNALQKKVMESADFVYAVGPFLAESARNKLKRNKVDEVNVIELIPGLAKLENLNLDGEFRGMVYGRLGADDEIVKQGKLAVASFFKACQDYELNDTILTVVGLDEKELKEQQLELQKMGFEHGKKLCNVLGLSYKSREDLYEFICEQSISMMLSTHEGFGLAGWEAISAEVPLILSIDTGLYKFLDQLGGKFTGCIYGVKITGDFEKDVETVAPIIRNIKNDLSKAKKNAKDLRHQLEKYSWERTAEDFMKNIPVDRVLEEYSNVTTEQTSLISINNEEERVSDKMTFLFSTSTQLSYKISKHFFGNIHYVWCAPKFDAKETNPSSANPYEIYKKIMLEVNNDIHGATLAKHKIGILRAASEKRQLKLITEEQEQQINDMIGAATMDEYRPVIYVIAANEVDSLIEIAPHTKKANVFSQEFLIRKLPGDMFELIDIDI